MGICCSCCCGEEETEEQKERKGRIHQLAQLQVIQSSLPVFIAAGVNNFVSSLIELIAEDSEDHVGSLIGQSLAYTVIVFVVGKIVVYEIRHKQHEVEEAKRIAKMKNLEEEVSRENSIVTVSSYGGNNTTIPPPAAPTVPLSRFWQTIFNYKLDEFICGTLTENAGFAWKEFLVIYILEFFNEEYGYGPAWGMWIMWVGIFLITLRVFARLQRNFHVPHHLGTILLHFDAEAYAFAIAFVLSALIALGFAETGNRYTSNESFLFEWKQDNDESEGDQQGGSDGIILYFSAVSIAVGLILLVEDLYFKVSPDEGTRGYHHPGQQGNNGELNEDSNLTITKQQEESKTKEIRESMFEHMLGMNPHEHSAARNLWHNFLGYFLGLSWFLFIVDFIMASVNKNLLAAFLNALVVAGVLTWRAPSCITSSVVRSDKMQDKLVKKKRESEPTPDQISRASTLSHYRGSNQEQTGCWASIVSLYHQWEEFYIKVAMHRRIAMISAVRLAVGWSWEILTIKFFELVTEEDHLSKELNVLINLVIAIVIIIIALLIHWSTLSWKVVVDEKNNPSGPPASQNNDPVTSQSIIRETDNPLRIHAKSVSSGDEVASGVHII